MADLQRGQRIKALREAHAEYGQKHLAAAAGVSLRAYQAWEAGGGIKVENAKALAKFLKVDWRWLINGETAPAKGRATPDLMATVNGTANPTPPPRLAPVSKPIPNVRSSGSFANSPTTTKASPIPVFRTAGHRTFSEIVIRRAAPRRPQDRPSNTAPGRG